MYEIFDKISQRVIAVVIAKSVDEAKQKFIDSIGDSEFSDELSCEESDINIIQ